MFLSDPLHMVWLRERLIEEHGSVLAGIAAMREVLARGESPTAENESRAVKTADTPDEELEEALR